jgi:hypothetical protein
MSSAGGGSINMRIGLRGADEVKRELAAIGPAGAQMGRQLDHALRQPGAGLKALDASMASARGGISNMAGSVGMLSGPLQALGPVGMAVGAGLAAAGAGAAIAFGQLKEAANWAATLTDTADRIGVTTEALQTLRYVADETGVPIEALESGLQKLNASLGAFQTGVGDTRVKEAFERLGISRADLEGIDNASQLLPILANALSKVESQAERVQLAKRLGVAELEPMLRRGADGLASLGAEGAATGHVLANDVIANLDETDRALERNEQQIANNVRSMQANLSPFFVWCSDWLAKLSRGFTDLLNRGAAVEKRNDRVLEDQVARGQERVNFATRQSRDTGRPMSAVQEGWVRDLAEARAELERRRRSRSAAAEPSAADRARETVDPDAPRTRRASGGGGGGRGSAANDAAREDRDAEARQRRTERVDDAITRAKQDQLGALAATATSLSEIHAFARERLALEQESAVKAQERFIAEGAIEEAKAAELRATLAATHATEGQALAQEQRLEREAALTDAQNTYTDMTRQVLEATAAGATTAAERRSIELQLLDIAHERLAADLRAKIAAEKDAGVREQLVATYNQLPVLKGLQTKDVERRTAGALERWHENSRVDAANIQEYLTGETLDALDGLNRGLIDALKNTERAEDAFKAFGDVAVDALGQIVDALLEVALQKMLIEPLVNGIFGQQGGGGGGGGLGNLFATFAANLFSGGFGGGGGGGAGGGGLAGGGVYADGGLVAQRVGPGRITGPGGPRDDAILARVSAGEFIVNAASTRKHYGLLEMINAAPHFADGGMVGLPHQSTPGFEAEMRSGGGESTRPIINVEAKVTVVNNGDPVTARSQMGPDGISLILDRAIENKVRSMGATGELARAGQFAPRGIKR